MVTKKKQFSANSDWRLSSLVPIMVVIFSSFLVIGMAIPVVPLYVSQDLHSSAVIVGIAVSCEFLAALFSRIWSGHYSDTSGAKRTVIIGICLGIVSGLLYFVSLACVGTQSLGIAFLFLARTVLGASESFVITGSLSWGLSSFGPEHAGKVISWTGTALWGAFAVGAPAGTALYEQFGFSSVALVSTLLPLVTLLVVAPLAAPPARSQSSKVFAETLNVLHCVWLPGIGLALTAIGFGSINTFGALLFATRHWDATWLLFTSLSVSFIVGRVFLGHLPDKKGGAPIALVFLLIEGLGTFVIWLAPSPVWAFLGAAITGLGYALVYPGFGLEAIRLTPPEHQGLAMGAFTAFLDLSLGIAGPVLGYIAGVSGLGFVYLVSAIVVFCATPVALLLMKKEATR